MAEYLALPPGPLKEVEAELKRAEVVAIANVGAAESLREVAGAGQRDIDARISRLQAEIAGLQGEVAGLNDIKSSIVMRLGQIQKLESDSKRLYDELQSRMADLVKADASVRVATIAQETDMMKLALEQQKLETARQESDLDRTLKRELSHADHQAQLSVSQLRADHEQLLAKMQAQLQRFLAFRNARGAIAVAIVAGVSSMAGLCVKEMSSDANRTAQTSGAAGSVTSTGSSAPLAISEEERKKIADSCLGAVFLDRARKACIRSVCPSISTGEAVACSKACAALSFGVE